jgi:hypothetical protein
MLGGILDMLLGCRHDKILDRFRFASLAKVPVEPKWFASPAGSSCTMI